MTAFVALLRAVNVGGRKLLMSDLKSIAEELGLGTPKTFIASGNLLFTSDEAEATLAAMLEAGIGKHMSAQVPVMIRTAGQMERAALDNPFRDHPGNRVMAIFLPGGPPANALETADRMEDEQLALGTREIYISYPSGMARSKLRLPAAAGGTARNMNSVAKIAALLKDME